MPRRSFRAVEATGRARLGRTARPARSSSRERGVEGLMLKRLDSAYRIRPRARRLVEVEDRPADHRRRAALRAARPRTTLEPLHRLHLRGVGRAANWCRWPRRTPASTDTEISELDRWIRANTRREVRPGALGRSRSTCSSSPSRHRTLAAPQVRRRGALSAHRALAARQARSSGRYPASLQLLLDAPRS